MKLSRRVPARTKTVEFEWCKKDFMRMSKRFREVRSRSRNPMDKCWWCGHPFENGEMMALAHPKKLMNRVLCQTCAEELLPSAAAKETP